MHDWLLLLDPFTGIWAEPEALQTARGPALEAGGGRYAETEAAIDRAL